MENSNTFDTEDFEQERIKINNINEKNINIMSNIKKILELLDNIEESINIKTNTCVNEVNSLHKNISDDIIIFNFICNNLLHV